ncbi:MAG: LysM peptidoglycan-binding domain-containing protein [Chloroflexi bacterium]|nr:LysM peptidoglycan-binding domain-containing protein [Chloroflexota bacterium]
MRHFLILLLGWWLVVALAACSTPSQPDAPPATPEVLNTPAAIQPTAPPAPSPTRPIALSYPTSVSYYVDSYVVRAGDTLGQIATRFNVDLQELMRLNGLKNSNSIRIGQTLKIPTQSLREAPATFLLPDSEVVYSPAYLSFDVTAFANQKGGYLVSYREKVEGDLLTGPQIIQLIAERYSVGPRVLLALLEFQGGWVTNKSVTRTQQEYSMGLADPAKATLFYQASWAANQLNEGYYGKITGRLPALQFKDRTRARLAAAVNPGTAAIQNVLALNATWDTWLDQIGPTGFIATYRRLFGDPTPIDPLVPPDLEQPHLRLPWKNGASWYFTGGPHSPWGDYGAWGAIDLTPRDTAGAGCVVSEDWAIAAAPGRVIRAEHGRVIVSLSNSNFQGSGWSLLYMHMASAGRVAEGTRVDAGDPIGHPSCEGGVANASHLHFARLYNGQWIDPVMVPFILSGWQIIPSKQEYDGTMQRGSESHEALNTRNDYKNLVVADEPQ